MEAIEIKHSLRKMLFAITIGLMFMLTGFHMLLYVVENFNISNPSDKWLRDKYFTIVISNLTICCSGIGVLIGINNILFNRRKVAISTEGVIVYSFFGTILVLWEDVEEIRLGGERNRRLILIQVEDIQTFMDKHSWSTRKVMKLNMFLGYPPVTISLFSTNTKAEDFITTMNQYLEKWRAKHGGLQSTLKEYER